MSMKISNIAYKSDIRSILCKTDILYIIYLIQDMRYLIYDIRYLNEYIISYILHEIYPK